MSTSPRRKFGKIGFLAVVAVALLATGLFATGTASGMNKAELIDAIASDSGLSKADAKRALDGFIDETTAALKKGDRVTLVGFGSFSVSRRSPEADEHAESADTLVQFKAGDHPRHPREDYVDNEELSRLMADQGHTDREGDLTADEALRFLDSLADVTLAAVSQGDDVTLVSSDSFEFGSFSISKRDARKGRNPQTGKEIKIPAKNVVKFKAGADLSSSIRAARADSEPGLRAGNFTFVLDGREMEVQSVIPGAVRFESEKSRESESKRLAPEHGTWRVEKAIEEGDTRLKDLFQAFATGARKMNPSDAGSLVYLDREGNEARRINFFGYVPLHYEPVSLDSRNPGQAAVEVMEFQVSRVEYGMAEGDGGEGDQTTQASRFKLDLITGSGAGPASNWYSISGGHQILHKTDKTTGEDQWTGRVETGQAEIVGPFVSGETRAELLQILNTWARQKGERFNATLELLDSSQEVVRKFNLIDCFPTAYHPPSVRAGDDSLLEERFSFKPERVEG